MPGSRNVYKQKLQNVQQWTFLHKSISMFLNCLHKCALNLFSHRIICWVSFMGLLLLWTERRISHDITRWLFLGCIHFLPLISTPGNTVNFCHRSAETWILFCPCLGVSWAENHITPIFCGAHLEVEQNASDSLNLFSKLYCKHKSVILSYGLILHPSDLQVGFNHIGIC